MKPITSEGFDVIGDVHGCGDQLVALLETMGYTERQGAYRHPNRQAVFVGDLIDRGPKQVAVVALARAMADAGTAHVVMGNHEFNAVAYATPDPDRAGEFLRPHCDKNRRQHAEFLAQIGEGSHDRRTAVEWFSTLPLWLDLDGLRVAHACWDQAAIDGLSTPFLDEPTLRLAAQDGTNEFAWVEHLCKGPEVKLPDGYSFHDKDGHHRDHARFRWWDAGDATYATATETPPRTELPDAPIAEPPVEPYTSTTPVLFGHYWRTWPQVEMVDNAACVDYSAVNGGPLVAYRWSGETNLVMNHLVGIDTMGRPTLA